MRGIYRLNKHKVCVFSIFRWRYCRGIVNCLKSGPGCF